MQISALQFKTNLGQAASATKGGMQCKGSCADKDKCLLLEYNYNINRYVGMF